MKPVVVIKIGGAVPLSLVPKLWEDITFLRVNFEVIVVHGGGPQSTAIARKMGHEPIMVAGRRVTSDTDLEISKMAIPGQFNTELTASAIQANLPGIGISGIADRLVQVVRRPPWQIDGRQIDFGMVGDVVGINTGVLQKLLDSGLMPVVATMGIDDQGFVYNVNADTVSAEIAMATKAERLIFITETGGVLDEKCAPIETLSRSMALAGIENGWIGAGMTVKVNTALRALEAGVGSVMIAAPDQIVNPSVCTSLIEDVPEESDV